MPGMSLNTPEGLREAIGGRGEGGRVNGSEIKFFHKNWPMFQVETPRNVEKKECDQLDTRLTKYDQNSERTLGWNGQSGIVQWSQTLSGRTGHCPTGVSRTQNRWLDLVRDTSDIVWWGRTLSGRRSLENAIFYQNPLLSSQVWFLSYIASNQMKLGHEGHLNTSNKCPKVVFPKSKDFPSDFGWTQKPRFWGNEEKSMKLMELEP
jgi:hypothetical protein